MNAPDRDRRCAPGEESDPAREAALARERAVLALLEHHPGLPPDADALVMLAVETADAATRGLARQWLIALGNGPDPEWEAEEWWWRAAEVSDPCVRAQIGYALGLARREVRIRGHQRWDEDDVDWVFYLGRRCGYRFGTGWTAWEAERLAEHFGAPFSWEVQGEAGRRPPGVAYHVVTGPLPVAITELTEAQAAAMDLGECGARQLLSHRDLAILQSDPGAGESFWQPVECIREDGHDGEHVSLPHYARARYLAPYLDQQPSDWEQEATVWAWWTGDGPYRITAAEHCEIPVDPDDPRADDNFCYLPEGHPGRHLYRLSPPVRSDRRPPGAP